MKTQERDIIDCVDINKQPTLDHPVLENNVSVVYLMIMKVLWFRSHELGQELIM